MTITDTICARSGIISANYSHDKEATKWLRCPFTLCLYFSWLRIAHSLFTNIGWARWRQAHNEFKIKLMSFQVNTSRLNCNSIWWMCVHTDNWIECEAHFMNACKCNVNKKLTLQTNKTSRAVFFQFSSLTFFVLFVVDYQFVKMNVGRKQICKTNWFFGF